MGVTANEPNPLYHYKRSISDELTSILVVWNRIASQCSRSVLLSHGGIILDQKLLRRLSNVDVLIGGHSHVLIPTPTELFQPEYGVPVSLEVGEQYPKLLHTGANGRYIGLVRMEWDPSYSTRIKYHDDDSVNIQTEVLPLEVIAEPDPDWQETEEPTSHPQGKRVRFTVPDSTGLVCSHSCRPGDCLLGNVVTDAMKYCLEHGPCRGGNESWSGIALLESGTLRDCLHPTHYDFSHVLPWPNQLVVLQLRGSTIRKMIEHGLKSTLPPHTSGAFLQVSGIEYQYYSDRVHEIKYNHNRNAVLLYTTSPLTGLDNIDDVPRFVFEKRSTEFPICKKLADKKLRDNDGDKRMHWAVVTDWLASGGDGFGPFVAEAETVLFTNVSMHDAIWNYASARRELTYHLNHRSYYPCCPQFVDSIFPFLRWFGYNHACTY